MKVRSRFSYFRDKFQVFVLGFLLGIVLGGGFFLLKLDAYIKELSFYKQLTQKDDKEISDENQLAQENPERPRVKKPKKIEQLIPPSDSTAPPDTSSANADPVIPGDNDIVVKKDELLGQRMVPVQNLEKTEGADSLAAPTGAPLTVEFWKSPLNYRGYKYSRSRLILFGFEMDDVQSIFKSGNTTYLKSAIGVFRLDFTSDFRQLERVTDESLIARMQ
jgi:hypothetical protein